MQLFQIFPFYNTFIEKPNVQLLKELPFYDELHEVHLVDMQEVIKLILLTREIQLFN